MAISNKQRRNFRQKLQRLLTRNKKVSAWERPKSLREKAYLDNPKSLGIGKLENNINLQFTPGLNSNRFLRYKEFDIMDMTSPMCGNALDTYASNATLADKFILTWTQKQQK